MGWQRWRSWAMDRYFNLEPTPSAYRAVRDVPDDTVIRFVSLIRLRRDQPDGTSDQAMREWDRTLAGIRGDAGGTVLAETRVLASSSASPGTWDRLIVTEFANRKAALRFLADERWLDNVALRRAAIELSPTVLSVPTPFEGRSLAAADDYGPPVKDVSEVAHMGPVVAAARSLPPATPFVWLSALRLRQDRSPGLTRAAYAGWCMVFNAVAEHHGVERILNDSIACTLVGADQRWDFINVMRYRNLALLETMLADPRILAASAMRMAAIEDSVAILATETVGAT